MRWYAAVNSTNAGLGTLSHSNAAWWALSYGCVLITEARHRPSRRMAPPPADHPGVRGSLVGRHTRRPRSRRQTSPRGPPAQDRQKHSHRRTQTSCRKASTHMSNSMGS
eukprot:scaffold154645_cov32-Prasinocladus_malaysianus.AAC.1